jgi:hypothetical protein
MYRQVYNAYRKRYRVLIKRELDKQTRQILNGEQPDKEGLKNALRNLQQGASKAMAKHSYTKIRKSAGIKDSMTPEQKWADIMRILIEKSLEKLVNTAKIFKLETTFNRAFDFCNNQDNAIEILKDFKFDRILSAGSTSTIEMGYAMLESLLSKTKNKIGLIACGGINQTNILPLLDKEFESIHFAIRKKTVNDLKTSILGEDYISDIAVCLSGIYKRLERNGCHSVAYILYHRGYYDYKKTLCYRLLCNIKCIGK